MSAFYIFVCSMNQMVNEQTVGDLWATILMCSTDLTDSVS